jgi:hypothetical protein
LALGQILLGIAGLLVLAGLWMIASHFANRRPSYGRLPRFDAEAPPRRQIGRLPAGLVLVCAGAVVFLVAALVTQPN